LLEWVTQPFSCSASLLPYTKETQNAAKNLEQKFTFQLGTLKLQGINECLSAIVLLMMIKNVSISRNVRRCPAPPKCLADPSAVDRAICVLREARKPLVIIGKGIYKKIYYYSLE